MNLNLDNKGVLITGASRGVGLAVAESFVQEEAQNMMDLQSPKIQMTVLS
jgi:NAD(P)-dependent dehydrogenase (short-subunit alcohol dehydrogenase family)